MGTFIKNDSINRDFFFYPSVTCAEILAGYLSSYLLEQNP